ncbi:MAG: histidine phosphatase family protein, partial [Flavobacteriales bacterium]|nr:histidine phosphatase family protein [Flavobacteriales bacterium]
KMPMSVSMNPWFFFETSWNNNQYKTADSESGEECANRAFKKLTNIANTNKCKCILVCSHSNLIGYFLKSIDNTLPFSWFKEMKCPALYDINFEDNNFSWNKNLEFPNGIAGH